ncbi:hypothetical protein [Micromonospora sp. NPDC049679]|uniref:hypothetical protein n=1 Tax=Micromonospora sp. NPDC049679 TaxID=3155920 RepID=UPI0033F44B6F
MRVVRTIVGMLLLTIGVPALFVGGALWVVSQHRDAGGAFSGSMQPVDNPGSAIIVADLDAMLSRDAPFAKAARTTLRITAQTEAGPAFVGIAPAAEAASYLSGLPYAQVDAVGVARGPLPVLLTRVAGAPRTSPVAKVAPGAQPFWLRQGIGAVDWNPGELRGQQLSMIIMRPDGRPVASADLRAEVRPGWLDATGWGLLTLGTLLLGFGMAVLAWPIRPREVVFVVEPDQLPAIAARLGVRTLTGIGLSDDVVPADRPAPDAVRDDAGAERPAPPAWPVPSARPTTLADTAQAPLATPAADGAEAVAQRVAPGPARPPLTPGPALPMLAWPPAQGPNPPALTPPIPLPLNPQPPALFPQVEPDVPAAAGPRSTAVPAALPTPLPPVAMTLTAPLPEKALPLPPSTWRSGPLPVPARADTFGDDALEIVALGADTEAGSAPGRSLRHAGENRWSAAPRERRGADAAAGRTTGRHGAREETPDEDDSWAALLPVARDNAELLPGLTPPTPGLPGAAPAVPGLPGAAPAVPGLPGATPTKRRRKTAGGLPAPDVLPIIVPPLKVPPMNVMTRGGGGQNRRRSAAKSTNSDKSAGE